MMLHGQISDGEKTAFQCYKKTNYIITTNSEYFIFYFIVIEKLIKTIYEREGKTNLLKKLDNSDKNIFELINELLRNKNKINDKKFNCDGLHDFRIARNELAHYFKLPEKDKIDTYKETAERFKNQYITTYGLTDAYNEITVEQDLDLVSYANKELSIYNSKEDKEFNDKLKAYIQSLFIPSGIEVVNEVNIQKVKSNINPKDLKEIEKDYYLKCKNDTETLKKIVYSGSHYSMSFNRDLKNIEEKEEKIKIEVCIKDAINHQLSLIKILGYPGNGKSTYLWSMAKDFSTANNSIIIDDANEYEKICKYIFETLDNAKIFLIFIDDISKKEKINDFLKHVNKYTATCKIVVIVADRTSHIHNYFATPYGKSVEMLFSNKYYQYYFPSNHAYTFVFNKILGCCSLNTNLFETYKSEYSKIDTSRNEVFGFYEKTDLLLRSLNQSKKINYATDKDDWIKIAKDNLIPSPEQIFDIIAILQNDDRDTPVVFFEKYFNNFDSITFKSALANNAGRHSPIIVVFPDHYNLRNSYICSNTIKQLQNLIDDYHKKIIACLLQNLDESQLLGLFKELMRKDKWYKKIVATNDIEHTLQSHIDKNDGRKSEYAILLHKVLQQKYDEGIISFDKYIKPLEGIAHQKVYTRLAFAHDKEDPTVAIIFHNKALKLDPNNGYSLWGKFRSYVKFIQMTQKPSDEYDIFLKELAEKSKKEEIFAYTFLQNIIKSNAPFGAILEELKAIFKIYPSLQATVLKLFIDRKLDNDIIYNLSNAIISRLQSKEENTISYIENNLKLLTKLSRSWKGKQLYTINKGLNKIYDKLSSESIQSPTIDNLFASYLLHSGQSEKAKVKFTTSGSDIKHIFNLIKCYNSELAYSFNDTLLKDAVSYIDSAIVNFNVVKHKENVVKLQLEKYLLYDKIYDKGFIETTLPIKENLLQEIETSIDDTLKKDETIWIRFLIYKYNFYSKSKSAEVTILEELFEVIQEEYKNKKHNTKLRKLYVEAFLNHKNKEVSDKFLFITDITLDTNDVYDSIEMIKDCISFLERNKKYEKPTKNFYEKRDAAKDRLIEQIKKYKGTIGSNTKEKNNLATIFMYAEEWQDVDQNLELDNINNYTLKNIPFVNTILNYIENRTKYLLETKKERYNRILELTNLIKILEDNNVKIIDYTIYRTFACLYYLLDDQENTDKYFKKFFDKIKADVKDYDQSYLNFCNKLLQVRFELFQAKYAYKIERFSKQELYNCLEKLDPIIHPISANIYKEINVGIGNKKYDTNRAISIFVFEIFKKLKVIYDSLIKNPNGFANHIEENLEYIQKIFGLNNTLYDRYTFDFLLYLFKDKKYTNKKNETIVFHNRPEVKKIMEAFVNKYENSEDCEINRFIAIYYLDIKDYSKAEIFNEKSFKNIDEKHDRRFLSYSNFNTYEIVYNKTKERKSKYTTDTLNDLEKAEKCLEVSHTIYLSEIQNKNEDDEKKIAKKIKDITDRYNKNLEEIEKLKYEILQKLSKELIDSFFKNDILNIDKIKELEQIEKNLKGQLKYIKNKKDILDKEIETIAQLKILIKNIYFRNNRPLSHNLNTKKGIDAFVGIFYSQLKIFNDKELDQTLKNKINQKLTIEINKYKTIKKSLGGTLE